MFHVVVVVVLLACFAIGTFSTLNIGALALAAALVVGTVFAGESVSDVLAGFPVDLFLLIFGVTYLFGLAAANGTMEYVLQRLAGRLGTRRALLPPALFVVTLAAVSIGAALPAVSAVIGGLAVRLSRGLQVPVILTSLMVLFGGIGGTFSPITLGGVIVHSTLARGGLAVSQVGLYVITLGFSVLFAVAVLVVYNARSQRDRRPAPVLAAAGGGGEIQDTPPPPSEGSAQLNGPEEDSREPYALTVPRLATMLAIVVLAVGLLGFGLDIGMMATVIAVLLHLAFPRVNAEALQGVNWSVLLMLCGIVTYIELLQRGGTIDALGDAMVTLGSPLIAVFLLCLIIAAFSAVASSAALLATGILLLTPFIASGSVTALGVTAALAVSATAVDVCPVSSSGALLVASAPQDAQRELYRGLWRWTAAMIVVAPILSVGFLVVPGV